MKRASHHLEDHQHGGHHHEGHGGHHHEGHGGHHHHHHHHEGGHPGHHDEDHDHHWLATLGVDLYLGLIYNVTGKTAEEIHLLDCGAGPGTYAKYMLERGLGKATLLDCDEKILKKAGKILENYGEKVKIVTASMTDLPFEDSSFDAISFNNCLHHIHNSKNLDFSPISKAFHGAHRVLKPGGIIIVNEATPIQSIVHWSTVFPEFVKDMLALSIPSDTIPNLLKKNGSLNSKRISCPDDEAFSKELYTGGDVTQKSERCEPPEFTEMVEMLTCPEERQKLSKFKDCVEELRDFVGHYTLFWAQK